jgi:hypothetical protein
MRARATLRKPVVKFAGVYGSMPKQVNSQASSEMLLSNKSRYGSMPHRWCHSKT